MIKVIKKINIFIFGLLITACAVVNIFTKENYTLFNKKFYFKDGVKISLKEYLSIKPEIIKNNNDVFVISLSKNIIKISLIDKKIEWIKTINTIPENNFIFDEDYIYFNGINNNFYILNYKTGDIEYIYLNSNASTINDVKEPIIHKNFVVAFFNDKRLVIFDKNNKKVLLDQNYNNFIIDGNFLNIDGIIFDLDNNK